MENLIDDMKRGREKSNIAEVLDVVSDWRKYAKTAGIPGQTTDKIYSVLRLDGFK